MHFSITHTVTYRYSAPVQLMPHWVRLRPRCDIAQRLLHFSLEAMPTPQQRTDLIDWGGNGTSRLSFEGETERLVVTMRAEVETLRQNPFEFLLEPWAVQLPLDYPSSLRSQLSPYLDAPIDPEALKLGQEIAVATDHRVIQFLTQLNQTIYNECGYQMRERGAAWPAGVTWRKRSGSCRDVAVLFMAVCRAMGLAARFVSGYQEGDPDMNHRHLHGWVEVYLPGAGWRGYDPTHGLAVSDRHVALVAKPDPAQAAPVQGSFQGAGVGAEMTYDLQIETA